MAAKLAKQEVVINQCFGGFSLSHAAMMRLAELKGIEIYPYVHAKTAEGGRDYDRYELFDSKVQDESNVMNIHYTTKLIDGSSADLNANYYKEGNREMERNDPDLVQVVKELEDKADGSCADLCIIKIPAGVSWQIEEYDGQEWVAETHRVWS